MFRLASKIVSKVRGHLSYSENTITLKPYNSGLDKWIRSKQEISQMDYNFTRLPSSLKLNDDANGMLLLKSRFENATSMNFDEKHSIIISSDSYFTKLIIQNALNNVLHHRFESGLSKEESP